MKYRKVRFETENENIVYRDNMDRKSKFLRELDDQEGGPPEGPKDLGKTEVKHQRNRIRNLMSLTSPCHVKV